MFVLTLLPRSKCLLISWLSQSSVILELKKIKSVIVPIFPPSICHEVMGADTMIFIFWMLSFKPPFSLYSFTFIKKLFISCSLSVIRASLVAQTVKCLPTMQETRVWSLGWEVPLEKKMATHSSILAWKIPWTEEPGRLQSMGSQRVGHDWATSVHFTSSVIRVSSAYLRLLIFLLAILIPACDSVNPAFCMIYSV